MACNKPFLRFISHRNSKTGCDMVIPTPCGHCRGCLKDYIQSWTDRCIFESQTTRGPSAFVTLTYNDDHLPKNRSVNKDDVILFNKRFRYYLTKLDSTRRVKFYISSEYGLEDYRPHYHYIIFGFDPKSNFDMSALFKAWSDKKNPIGFFSADYLNPSRVKYCLKYVHKELSPDRQDDILKRGLDPLFHTCSNGIGFDWFIQHLDHILKNRGYVVNGQLRPLNRYYQDLFNLIMERSPYDTIKKVRQRFGSDWSPFSFTRDNLSLTRFANFERERHMAYMEYFNNET